MHSHESVHRIAYSVIAAHPGAFSARSLQLKELQK